MRYRSFLAILIGLTIVPIASGTTITFSPSPDGRAVVDSTGTAVATSSLVWVGNFTSTTFFLNPALTIEQNVDAIQLAGSWEQFGVDTSSGVANAGVTGAPAVTAIGLGGTIEDDSAGATKADYFDTKLLYVWIFDKPSVGEATSMGIFRATTSTTPWAFPTNAHGGLGDDATLSTTTAAAATIVAVGGVGTASSSQLKLASSVPEPSTLVFGILGAFATLCTRKRQKQR
jgi:hypothetical protein